MHIYIYIYIISHKTQQKNNSERVCRSLKFTRGHVTDLPRGASRCFLNTKSGRVRSHIVSQT